MPIRILVPYALLLASCLSVTSGCAGSRPAGSGVRVGGSQSGIASYYADRYHGRKTASGETFDQSKMTAAHRTLPFGTMVRVTNVSNGKSVTVRVNDRGPFVKGRVIDLSRAAAQRLGIARAGLAEVKVEVVQAPTAVAGGRYE
jgi:rare lipoprotein A